MLFRSEEFSYTYGPEPVGPVVAFCEKNRLKNKSYEFEARSCLEPLKVEGIDKVFVKY